MSDWFVYGVVLVVIGVPCGMLIGRLDRLREKQIVDRWRIVSVKATGTKDQRNIMVKAVVLGQGRLYVGRVMDWKCITDFGLEPVPTWVEAKLFDAWHDYHEGVGVQLDGSDEHVPSA